MVDSPGVSNLNPRGEAADPLTATFPALGNIASVIHGFIQTGLTADEAAEKIARFLDPGLLPALQTLATVLQAVEKYI